MSDAVDRICAHPLFQGFSRADAASLADCARTAGFASGAALLCEGEAADTLYLIRSGCVALQTAAPDRPPTTFQTARAGDFVGLSWLVPPYRWNFDARATSQVEALAFDAKCLRSKCDADHDLGYALMQRFVPALIARLTSARLQALDLYRAAP